ncbi:hypothetical protein ACFY1L_24900 [Streptomyces sp. NPDC001663]|uniref:hypothetical protein n=1 Tax=Streptomyces sp. NPDC001663 TaxID=3364597 RepID=UPI0036A7167C
MTRQHVAAAASITDPILPDFSDMPLDQLPPLDDPAVAPAVTAVLHDVARPLSTVAGSQGS